MLVPELHALTSLWQAMGNLDDLIERRKHHVEYLERLRSWNQSLHDPNSEHSLKSQSSTMSAHSSSPSRAFHGLAAGPPLNFKFLQLKSTFPFQTPYPKNPDVFSRTGPNTVGESSAMPWFSLFPDAGTDEALEHGNGSVANTPNVNDAESNLTLEATATPTPPPRLQMGPWDSLVHDDAVSPLFEATQTEPRSVRDEK